MPVPPGPAGGGIHAQRAAYPGAVPLPPHPAQRHQARWVDAAAFLACPPPCLLIRLPVAAWFPQPPSILRMCCGCAADVLRMCRGCAADVLRMCRGCAADVPRASNHARILTHAPAPSRTSPPQLTPTPTSPPPWLAGNFMLLTEEEESPLKAIDFGLAVFFDPDKLPRTDLGLEGTPWWVLRRCAAPPLSFNCTAAACLLPPAEAPQAFCRTEPDAFARCPALLASDVLPVLPVLPVPQVHGPRDAVLPDLPRLGRLGCRHHGLPAAVRWAQWAGQAQAGRQDRLGALTSPSMLSSACLPCQARCSDHQSFAALPCLPPSRRMQAAFLSMTPATPAHPPCQASAAAEPPLALAAAAATSAATAAVTTCPPACLPCLPACHSAPPPPRLACSHLEGHPDGAALLPAVCMEGGV